MTYRLNTSTKWRPGGVSNLKICHAQILLLIQKMLGEAIRQLSSSQPLLNILHQAGIHLDILPALLKDLPLPWRKEARDVFEQGVPFDGIFAWNTAKN
jgi:hypothetical protein